MPQPSSTEPIPGIHHSVTAPPGGFANYNYQATSNTKPLMTDYSIHSQVYRPTENEADKHRKQREQAPPRGKLEQRAGSLEKGVTGFLKKLEKKIG
jgi:hypothetical protein